MFAKIENNIITEWPIASIHSLFPNTSFPSPLTEVDLPAGYVMVGSIEPPEVGENQKAVPGMPVRQDGKWVRGWDVLDMSPQEIQERDAAVNASRKQQRADAYRMEADPLFFKAQRGEATMEEWQAKVAEIKARYPSL